MRSSRRRNGFFSTVFALLGYLLAAATVWVALNSLQAAPRLVRVSEGPQQCAKAMLDAVCSGDYAQAGTYLYGSPALESGASTESESGKLIWDAFVDSLEYELVGDCWVSETGISQKIRIHSMEFASVTEKLKDRSQTLLSQRVQSAVDVSEIYDDANNYREDFVMKVLLDAATAALQEDVRYQDQELTINLIYDQGKWWVIGNPALLSAISGGIV